MSEQINWIKVADFISDIPFNDDHLAEVTADGKRICLAHYKEQIYAFAARCPHASGQLAHGFIDALGNVVCPLHRYQFCMKNGRNVTGEGYYLKHWPVKVNEAGVFVGLDAKSLMGLF